MRIIGKALYGSNNYHIDGPQSDKDYKLFIAPEFIDLYNGKDKYGVPFGFSEENVSTMDFRKFDSLLRKGNVNTIEYLFSKELDIYDKTFIPYFELARKAFAEGYVEYVWDYYFTSAKGLVLNSIKRMNDSEESRRKATSRGIWMINFLSAVIKNGYCITNSLWDEPLIYKFPREVRFEEDKFIPVTQEEWLEMFEYIEVMVANNFSCTKSKSLLQYYDNELMLCAQNTIAAAIKKELEAR